MPDVTCLYIDDSGTRNPDRAAGSDQYRDWFALGGILISEEREAEAREAHSEFCEMWNIDYPLHSYDIRQRTNDFDWLQHLSESDYRKFMNDLTNFLVGLPVIGHGCVIDRPGYDARYRERYGRQIWHLCKTAFSVLCERAAKIANSNQRKLRVFPEAGDKTADAYIREYYSDLRANGMPFTGPDANKYDVLEADVLSATLYDLKFKNKSSQLAQIADLYLYPIARGGYEPTYIPFKILSEQSKLIDAHLLEDEIAHIGIKYSCFELVPPP